MVEEEAEEDRLEGIMDVGLMMSAIILAMMAILMLRDDQMEGAVAIAIQTRQRSRNKMMEILVMERSRAKMQTMYQAIIKTRRTIEASKREATSQPTTAPPTATPKQSPKLPTDNAKAAPKRPNTNRTTPSPPASNATTTQPPTNPRSSGAKYASCRRRTVRPLSPATEEV
jgi:hypothetical protein